MIKYIQPVSPKSAEGIVEPVYAQIKRDFGRIVEPFLLHSPLPELLAGAWMACRETELVGNVQRNIKEAVAATVSKQNQCPYCVDAHIIMLTACGDKEIASAIQKTEFGQIKDEKIKAIVEWAKTGSGTKPFSEAETPEIIGTAVYFHYINRMANVLLSETPLPINQTIFKGSLSRVASMMFSSAVKRPKTEGDSLEFLPEAELPADLAWASGSVNVAGAFARFAKAVEIDAEYALPLEVRLQVEEHIGRAVAGKVEFNPDLNAEIANRLGSEAEKSAAQLTLTTALASYRVDEKMVAEFRRHYPQDAKLLGALAWASFTAARKIGTRLNANY
jgi:AhpD family alkylhydroperoxidase